MKNHLLSKIFLFWVTITALMFSFSGVLVKGRETLLAFLFLPIVVFLLLTSLKTLKTGKPELIISQKRKGVYFYLFLIFLLILISFKQITRPISAPLPYPSPSSSPTPPSPSPIIKPVKKVIIQPNEESGRVNIRQEPNLQAKIIYQAQKGEEFTFIKEIGNWYEIKFQEKTGYVHQKYATVEEK